MTKILKALLYILIFLVPLFWLPFSFEPLEFNKQYLIFFLTSLSFLVWLLKIIFFDKEVCISKKPLDILILIFLLVAVLSTLFSVDKNVSLFGSYGRFSNGLFSLLSFIILYFLIKNNPQINFGKVFLISLFFTVFIAYLSISGLLAKLSSISPVFNQRTFNTISFSLEGLAVFLAVSIVYLVGKIIFLERWNPKKVGGYFILLILSFGLLVMINFKSSWLILVLSFALFLIFVLLKKIFREKINRLLLPIFLLFFSLIFLFINFSFIKLPPEGIPSQKISWGVSLQMIKENIKNFFLGSGIGTWQYGFSKFKPLELNNNPLWYIRFDRAGSFFAEILGTMGILGIIFYFLLIALFVLTLISVIQNQNFLVPGMAVLAAIFGQLVYYQNTSLSFLFWLFLGISMSSLSGALSKKIYSFKKSPELSIIFSSFLILLILIIGVGYFFAIRFYLADANYNRGFWAPSIEAKLRFFERAAHLNKNLVHYQIVLAQTYLLQIQTELAKSPEQQDLTKVQNAIIEAINRAKKTTEISSKNVAAWETLGMVYRDTRFLVEGASEWAIKSFEEAAKLEPSNPVFFTEIGKLYLSSDPSKARENLNKAKQLKPDYVDAFIQEALTFEVENNLDEAIKRMEEAVLKFPFDIESRFQLGRLYFNNGKTDEAISLFEQVISIFPEHSNSLYSLALCYVKKGEKEKAISYFEKVLELNPGNQDVIQKIEELKK